MSKRWTFSDDVFLAKHFDAVGDMCGTHDLGRAKGAATKRVKELKANGAWDDLQAHLQAQFDTLAAYYLKTRQMSALEGLCMTHVKAPYDWEDRFGFIEYDTPESREMHLTMLAKMAGIERIPTQAAEMT